MDSLIGNFQIFELDSDWTVYEEQLEMLLIAANVQECDKVPILLAIIGSAGYQLLRKLCSPDLPQSKSFEDLCNLMKNQAVQKGTETSFSMDISAKEVIGDQGSSSVQESYQLDDFNGHQGEFRLKEQYSGYQEQDKCYEVNINNNSGQLNGSNNVRPSHQEHQCDVCESTEHVRVNCKFKESVCHQYNRKGHVQKFCHHSSADRFQDQHTSTSAVSLEGNQEKVFESTSEQEQFNAQVESSSVIIGHQWQSKNNSGNQGTIFSRTSGHCNKIKSVQQSQVSKKFVHNRKVRKFRPVYQERKVDWSGSRERYRIGRVSGKSIKSSFSTEQIEHGHPGVYRVVFYQDQVFAVIKKSASGSFKNRHQPGYHKDYGRF